MQEDLINELSLSKNDNSIIMVIGVGGGGGNALNYMWNMGIRDVEFLACNTDKSALNTLNIPDNCKLVLGDGLGAGNNPERGRQLAIESLDMIKQRLEAKNIKMVFITAGMGGGTGTGASPVIAKLAQEMGLLTIANVTYPLWMEGPLRMEQATRGIEDLRQWVDSLLVINNDSIMDLYGELPMDEAFNKADDILASATRGISEIITVENAYIRVDFADLSRVMRGSGRAHMGVGSASGVDRAQEAARNSLCSPLLDNNKISGSKNILINISANDIKKVSYKECMSVLTYIQTYASYKDDNGDMHPANLIWGASSKPMDDDAMEVVVVATGFSDNNDFSLPIPPPMAEITPAADFFDEPTTAQIEKKEEVEEQKSITREPRRIINNAPAVLERQKGRYHDIEVSSKTPTYTRKNTQLSIGKSSYARSKDVINMESQEQAPRSGNLFGDVD